MSDWQLESSESAEDTEKVDNDFICYIVNSIKLFEAEVIDSSAMVSNLSMATVLQSLLMAISEVNFRKESAASLNSSEACSAIQKLTSELCIVHFKGK